jgi:2-polyprenyl-6-methoxyphenol hydroxylase-like FAD-dependent oxidoreductase
VTKRFDVIIVGGGPVGLALSVDLGLRGVRCALIERNTEQHRIPKGQNLTQRTMELFARWGVGAEMRKARIMPADFPIGEIVAYRDLTNEYWAAPPGRELVRDFYAQDNERIPQYCVEAVLAEKLKTLANVGAFSGWSARSVDQDDKAVRVTIRDANGSDQFLEAPYVVGCDGSRSVVREQIGIERAGTDFDQTMVLVVFRSKELHERLKRFPPRSTYRVMHPDLNGYWQFFGRIDVGEGWFFHAPVPNDTKRENFDFRELLFRATGFPFACELDHVGFWDLRVAVAEKYQVGRVFIAGDAAHSHPPYGAFGLNNGLEDAANLGWKIAAVLSGWGGEKLLETYGVERRPIFRDTAEDFIASRIKRDGAFLAAHDPSRDRAEFERAWKEWVADLGFRVKYEPHYDGSPIVIARRGATTSAHGTHSFKARPGHHLASCTLSNGKNLFDELGSGFTLLAFGVEDDACEPIEKAANAGRIPLKIIRGTFENECEAYKARLVLVRPDQYVAWAENGAPAVAGALMRTVVGKIDNRI